MSIQIQGLAVPLSTPQSAELTRDRILVVILKPSEKSIHSREDLAPVPESFGSHCYIFYPGILERNMRQTPLGASPERGARTDLYHVKKPSWVLGGGKER